MWSRNFSVDLQNLISFALPLWKNLANYNFKLWVQKLQFLRKKTSINDPCLQVGNFWSFRLSKHALIMVELSNGVWFVVEAPNH